MYAGLKDKIVIVTGAGGLIGKQCVKHLVQCGAKVVAVDVKSYDCEAELFLTNDITEIREIDQLLEIVMTNYGRIDGLVNLAYPRTADWGTFFENISYESWRINIDMQM